MAVSAMAATQESLVDKRDGKKYKTVKIGNQTWMAEYLKVKIEHSWCYKGKESNCQKYGRLYNWDTAKAACPAGWHLPSKEEFKALFVAVGSEDVAGKKLKSTSGWKENGNGEYAFGFSALPAGYRNGNGDFNNEGNRAYFWSSTEYNSDRANDVYLQYGYDNADLGDDNKSIGFSVRCLKD